MNDRLLEPLDPNAEVLSKSEATDLWLSAKKSKLKGLKVGKLRMLLAYQGVPQANVDGWTKIKSYDKIQSMVSIFQVLVFLCKLKLPQREKVYILSMTTKISSNRRRRVLHASNVCPRPLLSVEAKVLFGRPSLLLLSANF